MVRRTTDIHRREREGENWKRWLRVPKHRSKDNLISKQNAKLMAVKPGSSSEKKFSNPLQLMSRFASAVAPPLVARSLGDFIDFVQTRSYSAFLFLSLSCMSFPLCS